MLKNGRTTEWWVFAVRCAPGETHTLNVLFALARADGCWARGHGRADRAMVSSGTGAGGGGAAWRP
jgi:hypothetical protein